MKSFSSLVVLLACCYQIFGVDGYKCLPSGLNIPCRNLDETYCEVRYQKAISSIALPIAFDCTCGSLCPKEPEPLGYHTCPGTDPLLSCGLRDLKACRLWCDTLNYKGVPGAVKQRTTTEAPTTMRYHLRYQSTSPKTATYPRG